MSTSTSTSTTPHPLSDFIIRNGKPTYETWEPDPDNCEPYDGVEYTGHRLGQVFAFAGAPELPPQRIGGKAPRGATGINEPPF
jgi:hypothetical protein